MIDKCNEFTNNKIVPVRENKREFIIKNPTQKYFINKVKIDDCYIKHGLRCDYVFEIIENDNIKKLFYVELKGRDIKYAIKQLEATLKSLQNIHFNISDKSCYIISSKVPTGTDSQNLKKKFKKDNKIQLFIHTKQKEISL